MAKQAANHPWNRTYAKQLDSFKRSNKAKSEHGKLMSGPTTKAVAWQCPSCGEKDCVAGECVEAK